MQERDQRRGDQAITIQEASAAGWSEAEMLQMNDEAWNACLIAKHLDAVRKRGLAFFYHVGTNDNVCPALRQLGEKQPDFPIYILPGGQHGGPKTSGFTLQTPSQPEADENLLAFARHHFFDARSLPTPPKLEVVALGNRLRVTVQIAAGTLSQRNALSWCVNRHPPCTLATEYDRWDSVALTANKDGSFSAEIEVPATAKTIDFVSTHTQEEGGLPFHFSSPYKRWSR